MKPRIYVLATLLLAAAAIIWSLARNSNADSAAPATTAAPTAPATEAQRTALQTAPQAHAYRDRKNFEHQTRRFLRDAPQLGAVERSERARALMASVDAYEQAGQMSAGEAMMLRIGLIRASGDDEAEAATQIATLTERYRSQSDRREAAWLAQQQRDPRFQSYKARERAVVTEVMAMREIPGGLSRDEYLRQRLERERVRAYR